MTWIDIVFVESALLFIASLGQRLLGFRKGHLFFVADAFALVQAFEGSRVVASAARAAHAVLTLVLGRNLRRLLQGVLAQIA